MSTLYDGICDDCLVVGSVFAGHDGVWGQTSR